MLHRMLILLLSALLAAPAHAQRAKTVIPDVDDDNRRGEMARAAQQKAGERFTAADDNGDGKLTQDEAAAHLPYFAANFARYDKNNDGSLDWEEFVGHSRWEKPRSK